MERLRPAKYSSVIWIRKPPSSFSAEDTAASLARILVVTRCAFIKPSASQRYGLMVLPGQGWRRIMLRSILSKLCTAVERPALQA